MMSPDKINVFCCYFSVVLLFGWLNLVDSVSNSSQLKHKQTYGEKDYCEVGELEKYGSGMYIDTINDYINVFTEPSEISTWVDIAYHAKDRAALVFSLIPGFGSVGDAIDKVIAAPDDTKLCLAQMNKRIEEGINKIQKLIETSNEKTLEAIKRVEDNVKMSRIENSYRGYKDDIRKRLHIYRTDIEDVTNPKTTNADLFNKLKERCNTDSEGIRRIAMDFEYYLRDDCGGTHQYYNVKNFHSTLKTSTKTFKKKYDSSFDKCTAKLIMDLFLNNSEPIRIQLLNNYLIEGKSIIQVAIYCADLIYGKNLNQKRDRDLFLQGIEEKVYGALKSVENLLMAEEITKIKQIEKELRDKLSKLYDENKTWIKNHNYWIEDVQNLTDFCIGLVKQASLVFADGTLDHRIVYCPKPKCLFIQNITGMHVIFFMTNTSDQTYFKSHDSIDNFHFNFAEINGKVNKSNSNLTAIVEEFVKLDPFRHSRTTSGVGTAAIFFKKNMKNFKLGFIGHNFQPYAHRTVQTKRGAIKFIAPYMYNYIVEKETKSCELSETSYHLV
jgi:hypothetical protein